MKTKKLIIGSLLSGISLMACAQVAAPLSQQYTRTYTYAEVNALAKPISTSTIKENVYCSSVDILTNGAISTKRSFMLNSSGVLTGKTLSYARSQSSSTVQANATRAVTFHPGTEVSPILNTALQGYSAMSYSTSGNIRSFSYAVEGKTKTVLATSSGFFYTFDGTNLYMKGC